jgi:DNA-binding Xre family transcriptional regulator
MSESQKNIIEKLLKEKNKSKRELARILEITENSINRTIKNPKIAVHKLEKIAEFLEMDLTELIDMRQSMTLQEAPAEYKLLNKKEKSDLYTFDNLSEVIKIQSRTIEMMAETEKANSKNIEHLVKLITDKYYQEK